MNMLQNEKRSRKSQPGMESLDLRIAPTAIPIAAALIAELRVETHQVHRWNRRFDGPARKQACENPDPARRGRLASDRPSNRRLLASKPERLDPVRWKCRQSSLPSNVSPDPGCDLSAAYVQDPGGFPANVPATNSANLVVVEGNSVGIQVHDGNPADFQGLLSELQSDGMQVTISSTQYGTIFGLLPVAQLPAVAALSQMAAIGPEMQPVLK